MRANVEILVVDDSDNDAALTLDSLRNAVPDATVLRLSDGEQALPSRIAIEVHQRFTLIRNAAQHTSYCSWQKRRSGTLVHRV